MAKLDSLIVDVQLNTAELRKGLDDANKKLEGFGAKLNDLAGVVVFEKMAKMAATAVSGLVNFALKGAESVDRMGKLAQSAGTTVESFSRLAYVGQLGGLSVEELGAAMVKLNKNLSEGATGGKEQVALFAALGVQVTDAAGKVRSADVVMGDLAERFAGMADGASKTRLAVDVFGKSGAALIPMLNAGKAGLAELAKEADRLGITITTSAAASAERFNDNLQKLELAAASVGQRAAAELTPALANLTEQLLNSEDGARSLQSAAEVLATVLKLLASGAVIVGAVFDAVGTMLGRVASAAVDAMRGDFTAALGLQVAFVADVTTSASQAVERLGAIWGESGEAAKEAAKAQGKSADEMAASMERLKKSAQDAKAAMEALAKVAPGGALDVKQAGERSRASAAMTANIRERRQENVALGPGATPLQRAEFATRGFASFDEALDALAKQTRIRARQLDEATNLESVGKTEAAQKLRLTADEAGRAAERAGKAADAFEEVEKELASQQKAIMNMSLQVLSSIGEHGAEIAGLVNSAMQGLQAGGIVGAIVAVIANLFAKLEAVGQFIDILFDDFMAAFGQLNGSFRVLFSSLTQSLVPVMKGLMMVFDFIGKVLTPIFAAMENLMAPFEELANGLLGMLDSVGILDFVIKAVAVVFNLVSLAILGITIGIQKAWGAILDFVRGVIAFFTAGQGTAEIDATIAKHASNMAATEARFANVLANLMDPNAATGVQDEHGAENLPSATAPVEELGTAAGKAADNLNKFSAALTNVPQGFKYAARAFEATRAAGSWQSEREGSNAGLTVIVQGSVITEAELAEIMGDFESRNQFRRRGISWTGNTR